MSLNIFPETRCRKGLGREGADPNPPSSTRGKAGIELTWKSKIAHLFPTGTGERYSQTMSNLGHAALLRRCELPLYKRKCSTNSGGPLVNLVLWGYAPPSLTITPFPSWSADILFKDDTTVILILDISFMGSIGNEDPRAVSLFVSYQQLVN